jgi:predicted lysophospholipase L1 biosynthesis ABC-type transport system permease subunit
MELTMNDFKGIAATAFGFYVVVALALTAFNCPYLLEVLGYALLFLLAIGVPVAWFGGTLISTIQELTRDISRAMDRRKLRKF